MENVNKFQTLASSKVIQGSILSPHNAGLRFVLSVNNLAGKPEGNPLLPLFDKKWKKVREESRGWYATKTGEYKLGAVSTTAVQSDVWVVNMLCQDENLTLNKKGLEDCLKSVVKLAKYEKATIHVSNVLINSIPELTEMLSVQLLKNGVSVYLYEEPA